MRNYRLIIALVAIAALAVLATAPGFSVGLCAVFPNTDTYCRTQCSRIASSMVCFDKNPDRCCWEGPNSCGESTNCSDFCSWNCSLGGF